MQKALANFLYIVYIVLLFSNVHCSKIMDLPSWSWIECTSIKQNYICAFLFVFNIL